MTETDNKIGKRINYDMCIGKNVVVHLKNGETIEDVIGIVCDKGDDEPGSQFILFQKRFDGVMLKEVDYIEYYK